LNGHSVLNHDEKSRIYGSGGFVVVATAATLAIIVLEDADTIVRIALVNVMVHVFMLGSKLLYDKKPKQKL
jgi:hypothetical protein